jgi:glycosyltransferase involved in cell wall biosynthesis
VPPGDAAALAFAMRQALADPDRRRAMGQQGRVTVDAEFNAATEAARLSRLFTGYAEGTPPRDKRP